MPPKVSIITPAHNSQDHLEQCVQSVRNQTFTDWEHLIIIDSKSKDHTYKIAKTLAKQDVRLKIIESSDCISISSNRNIGLTKASGEYICFLDSDDSWHNEKLTTQLDLMIKNKIDFSFHDFETFVEKSGKMIVTGLRRAKSELTFNDLLKDNSIGCSTVMLKKELVSRFSFSEIRHEDYVLWLSILKSGITAYRLPKTLSRYRLSEYSISGNKIQSAIWRWNAYQQLNITLVRRIYYFIYYFIFSMKKRI